MLKGRRKACEKYGKRGSWLGTITGGKTKGVWEAVVKREGGGRLKEKTGHDVSLVRPLRNGRL